MDQKKEKKGNSQDILHMEQASTFAIDRREQAEEAVQTELSDICNGTQTDISGRCARKFNVCNGITIQTLRQEDGHTSDQACSTRYFCLMGDTDYILWAYYDCYSLSSMQVIESADMNKHLEESSSDLLELDLTDPF